MLDANKDWVLWEVIGEYYIWCRQSGWDTIWNATKGEKPTDWAGGYYRRETLLNLKGLNHE